MAIQYVLLKPQALPYRDFLVLISPLGGAIGLIVLFATPILGKEALDAKESRLYICLLVRFAEKKDLMLGPM